MTSDDAPLTKADGRHILEVMDQVLARLDSVVEELHVEIKASEERMKKDFHAAKEEMKGFFQVGIEIVREEVIGANKDRIVQHQDRLDDHDRRLIVLEKVSSAL